MPVVVVFAVMMPVSETWAQNNDPFEYYWHRIPWKEEVARLDNFAIFLTKNPETVGYVAYYSGKGGSRRRAKARAQKAVSYLTRFRRIGPRRIVMIYGGKLDNASTILQPVPKHSPPPDLLVPREKPKINGKVERLFPASAIGIKSICGKLIGAAN